MRLKSTYSVAVRKVHNTLVAPYEVHAYQDWDVIKVWVVSSLWIRKKSGSKDRDVKLDVMLI